MNFLPSLKLQSCLVIVIPGNVEVIASYFLYMNCSFGSEEQIPKISEQ